MCKFTKSPILSSYPTELKSINSPRRKDETFNFVLAYGPLKDEQFPFPSSPSFPVRIHGFKRSFNCKGEVLSKKAAILGVEPDAEATFTGLAIALKDRSSLRKLDEKQKLHMRRLVKKAQVEFVGDSLQDEILNNSKFWIYVPKKENLTSSCEEFPIRQSYFDMLVESCIKIGERCGLKNFAQDSLATTDGWLLPFFGQGPKMCWQFDRDEGIKS